MIQHVPTSEITTCIWTPLLEHLQGIQPPCKAPGRWAPSQVAGPFCPLLAAWTSEKLRRRWWRQSPSPKPHLWAETAGRSDFWILYAFMHSNMWEIETMVELCRTHAFVKKWRWNEVKAWTLKLNPFKTHYDAMKKVHWESQWLVMVLGIEATNWSNMASCLRSTAVPARHRYRRGKWVAAQILSSLTISSRRNLADKEWLKCETWKMVKQVWNLMGFCHAGLFIFSIIYLDTFPKGSRLTQHIWHVVQNTPSIRLLPRQLRLQIVGEEREKATSTPQDKHWSAHEWDAKMRGTQSTGI